MENYINLFKTLSDKTRLRILCVLLRSGRELCICEIMDSLDLPQYNISKHMKELKLNKLVTESRNGKFVFYSIFKSAEKINKTVLSFLKNIENCCLENDQKRLIKRISLRVGNKCVVGMCRKKIRGV